MFVGCMRHSDTHRGASQPAQAKPQLNLCKDHFKANDQTVTTMTNNDVHSVIHFADHVFIAMETEYRTNLRHNIVAKKTSSCKMRSPRSQHPQALQIWRIDV